MGLLGEEGWGGIQERVTDMIGITSPERLRKKNTESLANIGITDIATGLNTELEDISKWEWTDNSDEPGEGHWSYNLSARTGTIELKVSELFEIKEVEVQSALKPNMASKIFQGFASGKDSATKLSKKIQQRPLIKRLFRGNTVVAGKPIQSELLSLEYNKQEDLSGLNDKIKKVTVIRTKNESGIQKCTTTIEIHESNFDGTITVDSDTKNVVVDDFNEKNKNILTELERTQHKRTTSTWNASDVRGSIYSIADYMKDDPWKLGMIVLYELKHGNSLTKGSVNLHKDIFKRVKPEHSTISMQFRTRLSEHFNAIRKVGNKTRNYDLIDNFNSYTAAGQVSEITADLNMSESEKVELQEESMRLEIDMDALQKENIEIKKNNITVFAKDIVTGKSILNDLGEHVRVKKIPDRLIDYWRTESKRINNPDVWRIRSIARYPAVIMRNARRPDSTLEESFREIEFEGLGTTIDYGRSRMTIGVDGKKTTYVGAQNIHHPLISFASIYDAEHVKIVEITDRNSKKYRFYIDEQGFVGGTSNDEISVDFIKKFASSLTFNSAYTSTINLIREISRPIQR